jgi:uncharacterized DUF497 family protein
MSRSDLRISTSTDSILPISMMLSFSVAMLSPAKAGRIMAIGRFADGTIAVIFATLGIEGISIVSMRPGAQERKEAVE